MNFSELARYGAIFVTGPQRSGTTICARMISHDTGHRYIDEEDFRVHDFAHLRELMKTPDRVVVQCPALSRYAELLNTTTAHKLSIMIWMCRGFVEIVASQERIGWDATKERKKYPGYDHLPICMAKLHYWQTVQKIKIAQHYEVHYDMLKDHKLWIDKTERSGFEARQWQKS